MRLPAALRHSIRSKLTALVVATTMVALGVSGIVFTIYPLTF